ncbi:truncated E3 10.4K [Human mastadenovirus C]|nr:truncated E3 10.4K [Human mastadenovirus C]
MIPRVFILLTLVALFLCVLHIGCGFSHRSRLHSSLHSLFALRICHPHAHLQPHHCGHRLYPVH